MLDIIKISKSMEHNNCIHAKKKGKKKLSNLSHGFDLLEGNIHDWDKP